MKVERDLIQDEIYHNIAPLCHAHGWQLEFIDLRWGISSATTNILEVCLDELTKCKESSCEPFLVILLGNRYGWVPLPERIPTEQWNILLKKAANNECNTNLTNCYIEDKNCIPHSYILKEHKGCGDQDYKKLSIFFDKCEKDNSITKTTNWVHLHKSATHLEIDHGV